jgi:tetratricopeptide (TPR) repeat protein
VDPASAVALGQRTGAGLAIIGQLVGTGVDSLRLTATLLDVSTGRTIREIEIRDLTAQVDRMSDSLTVVVLSELAQSRPIGSLRLTSLGSTSVPALKAYLQGEQFYRRAAWDSALTSYERAVNLDSMFAPAIRRLGDAHSQVAGHGCFIACPEWPLLMRAGARNHGLAPRESTLIAIDSVYATLRSQDVSPGLLRRLFVMLTAATRSYPNDPEVWYAMGEAQNHLGLWPAAAVTGEQALQSFEKSIALDSGFAPAYPDAIILALYERDPPEAQRLAARYLEIAPRGGDAAVLRLVRRLSRSDRAGLREAAAAMDTVPIQVLEGAAYWFLGLPDSAETVLRIIRAYVARPDAEGDADEGVAYALASRGHVREAYARIGSRFPHRFVDLALTGLVTGDAARAVFDEWLRGLRTHRSGDLQGALPWWASRGDTASLQQFIQRADSEAARDPSPWGWSNVSFDRLAARAYLTLARRDSTEALAQFMVLPDTICLECLLSAKLTTVRLLVARGRFREAAVLLDLRLERAGFLPGPLQPEVWVLERGRVNDRLGNRAKAIRAYRYIAEVWRNADPELQPYVQEARTALRRLGAGPER